MTERFNGLSPAEAERLAMLIEEASEVSQIACKILRHGYESHHPDSPEATNRQELRREVTDFQAVVMLMGADIPTASLGELLDAQKRKLKYAHHQGDRNV